MLVVFDMFTATFAIPKITFTSTNILTIVWETDVAKTRDSVHGDHAYIPRDYTHLLLTEIYA